MNRRAIFASSVPVEPAAVSVLSSLGLDLSSLEGLPEDEGEALDYIADNFGYEKPSECVRVLRGLRSQADQVRALLANTGITLDDFTSWASELDR